jgi:hypothetical protein
MASIYKRKNENGTTVWRAVVRIKGYPSVCTHWERKQEAEDWAQSVEQQIKTGQFKFDQHNKIHTFNDLVDRYTQDGTLEHHRSAEDTRRHIFLLAFSLLRLCPCPPHTRIARQGKATSPRYSDFKGHQKNSFNSKPLYSVSFFSSHLCSSKTVLEQ